MIATAPSRDALRALAAFLPVLETTGFCWGGWISKPNVLPTYSECDEARAFVQGAYRHGWVIENFDWQTWFASDEAVKLRTDAAVLEQATPEQLAKLLTAYVRGDHFNEGLLATTFDKGILTRIVQRAAALASE